MLALLGTFLIPIGTSSLRGLTHVLTCSEDTETPFTVVLKRNEAPAILSSASIDRGDDAGLCGGLILTTRVGIVSPGRIRITFPITNGTAFPWEGSMSLKFKGTTIPVSIGRVDPGETRAESVTVKIEPGTTEIGGSLLIGP